MEFALEEFPVAGLNIWVNEVKNEGILTAERGVLAYMVIPLPVDKECRSALVEMRSNLFAKMARVGKRNRVPVKHRIKLSCCD